MFQDRVSAFCGKLNADVKMALLRKIVEDKQFVAGENTWHHCSVIIELLDNGNVEYSKEILGQIKSISAGNHKIIVRNIAYKKRCRNTPHDPIRPIIDSPVLREKVFPCRVSIC